MSTRFSRTARALLTAVLVVSTAGACVAHAGGQNADKTTLRMAAIANGPFTRQFNPLLQASKDSSGDSEVLIYEPLLMNDMKHSTAAPWLAKSFAWSSQGKVLTIKLRTGVKWSDGQSMTAEDVAFTFDLMRKNPALNFYTLPISGASAPAADTAVITFSQPAYQYEWWDTPTVPKHVWASIADPVTYTNDHPVGTGPFTLKSFSSQAISLSRNASYWGSAPKVQTVQFLAYDSASSMVAALRSGQVDWITPQLSDPAGVAKLAPSKIDYWATTLSPTIIYLYPNDSQYPLNQAPVRLAMSQAIDRGSVSKLAFGGQNGPVESPTALDLASRAKLIPSQYRDVRFGSGNPSQAKRTLTSAGFVLKSNGMFDAPDGKSLHLTITVPTSSTYGDQVRAAIVISQQLKAAGIASTVKSETASAWRKDVGLGHFQLSLRGLGGNLSVYGLYNSIFDQNIKPIGKTAMLNFERYQQPQARQFLQQYAASAPGSPAEATAAAGLEGLMVHEAPIIPLFHVTYLGMWRTDRFAGWPSDGNPYALPIGGHINALKVLLAVRPAQP